MAISQTVVSIAIFFFVFSLPAAFYTPFFKEVWDKKPEIEQAFNMEDPSGLDDSGEGTLERPSHHYHRSITLPPPRRNMPPRSQSAEG